MIQYQTHNPIKFQCSTKQLIIKGNCCVGVYVYLFLLWSGWPSEKRECSRLHLSDHRQVSIVEVCDIPLRTEGQADLMLDLSNTEWPTN